MLQLKANKSVPWTVAGVPPGILPQTVFIGSDPFGLGGFQVAVATASSTPPRPALRELFRSRRGKTQIQLVVAVVQGATTHLLGPDPQTQPISLPTEQAQRQLQSVLDEPEVLAATKRITGFRKAYDSTSSHGFANNGLFASYHITQNVPQRADWQLLNEKGSSLLPLRGMKLIHELGFSSKPAASGAQVLSTDEADPRAIAVLLDDGEQFDGMSPRFQLSPVAYGLAVAAQTKAPWLIVLRKDQIRLYPGRDGVGVGAKGQSETYFEIDLATVDASYAGLLPLIFASSALEADGTADELIEESNRYATELGTRLRERIYDDVVPTLAEEVANQLAKHANLEMDADGLDLSYRVTLRILFRLLFQAYAEDRGLLPAGRNEKFDENSLKSLAQKLLDQEAESFNTGTTLWDKLTEVWRAIDQGNEDWQIPAYNGGLFSSDPAHSPDGALFTQLALPDTVLGSALKHLLIDITADNVEGPVDFRSLSVREFGTIYEGLLESALSKAEQDITLDKKDTWIPAKEGDEIHVVAGSIYFHSASGERKATGSYFTPKIIVDHLIERSLVPALEKHLEKIKGHLVSGDPVRASHEFFDFRVADLAMGSGHFLVAAVDKIEAIMRDFLTEHAVPGVTEELLRLAEVAKEALGTDEVAKSEVDELNLLRRQVARRCIYGLDINMMAVELARLALWIHTFVPGLPMSNLNHGLVHANSLTGIGTVDEALDVLQPGRAPGQTVMFDEVITGTLASAKTLLTDLANASEADKSEVEKSAQILAQARTAAEPAKRIFDVAVSARVGAIKTGEIFDESQIKQLASTPEVTDTVARLRPAHMPVLFPEVFLRENPGFDAILGNPPWEELMVEEPEFWLPLRPGLLGLKSGEMKREIKRLRSERPDKVVELEEKHAQVAEARKTLLLGPYPGLGTGDVDLYHAFAWRFLHLLRKEGGLGIVMPGALLNAAGPRQWREKVFESGSLEVITLKNQKQWVFPITPQYTVVVLSFVKEDARKQRVWVAGPFVDVKEFNSGRSILSEIDADSIKGMTGSTIPQLPTLESGDILKTIRKAPRLDQKRAGWDFRPIREFDATNDRDKFENIERGDIPVIGGAGFDLWTPSTGEVYAYGDWSDIESALQSKRKRQIRLKTSAFYGLAQEWASNSDTLSINKPRIAFRDVVRATDSRTVIAALVPPRVALTNKAPYLFGRERSGISEAYLLGVLASIPLDWYARRYVELGLNFHIFNGLPIPVFNIESAHCRRVVEVSGRLAAADERYADWAAEVGVPVGSVTAQSEKAALVAELDALVSLLYGLSRDQVVHVFSTFHRGWDYQPRLERVLEHFDVWKGRA